jgi:hypothetical protein
VNEDDRRIHPRFDTNVNTVCRTVAENQPIHARIRNVSLSGVNVGVDQEIPQGTMIRIELPHAAKGHFTTVLACVMNVKPESTNHWSLGCMFSQELTEAEMHLMGGEKKHADASDQREWVRFPVKGQVDYRILPGEEEQATSRADLVNVSPTGVGLLIEDEIQPGSVLSLVFQRHHLPPLTMLGCVVYLTRRADRKWAVGCNFIRELSERELQGLL